MRIRILHRVSIRHVDAEAKGNVQMRDNFGVHAPHWSARLVMVVDNAQADSL